MPTWSEPVEPTKLVGAAEKEPIFQEGKFDAVLATAAKLLVRQKHVLEASLLANGRVSITHWNHDNWNGGQDTWRMYLAIPVGTYLDLEGRREEVQKTIDNAVSIPMRVLSECDFIDIELTTDLEHDPDWRQKTRQVLSGEGINNQGRVHSQNIAARSYDHLLFRSRPEVYFYRALKAAGVAFAPLSVIVGRDDLGQKPRRIEPDFIIFKDGLVTVIEIDGDLYHTETPQEAHRRLKFLLDEGARLERLNASECESDDKAREAVDRVLMDIEKRRRSRV